MLKIIKLIHLLFSVKVEFNGVMLQYLIRINVSDWFE